MDKKEMLKALFCLIKYSTAKESNGFVVDLLTPEGKVHCKFEFDLEIEEEIK